MLPLNSKKSVSVVGEVDATEEIGNANANHLLRFKHPQIQRTKAAHPDPPSLQVPGGEKLSGTA